LQIESMDHLVSSFQFTEGDIHHSQHDKTMVKLKLLFWIPDEFESFKLVSVRVPRGLPVYRIRAFIKYMEDQLEDLYGEAKRANASLTAWEDSTTWLLEFELPVYRVQYA
jgi:hypothetical protein